MKSILPVEEVCVVVLIGLLVPEDEAAVDVPLLHLEGHYVQILEKKLTIEPSSSSL